MMDGCSFGCQLLCCSLQAPCVTHGDKYAILGDSLTCFRSCEAGQSEGRSQPAGLRAAFRSSVTIPSRHFRAWFGCSHRDGWCHLRCSKASELSTWSSRRYRDPVGDTCPSGVAARIFWCISNGSECLLGGFSDVLFLSPYHLILMEQTVRDGW